MSDRPISADSPLEEQLVAYLDGELSAEESRRIEELLAADPEVRLKLQQLDRTWGLLDQLETAQVADSFLQTTLEMVTVAASQDLQPLDRDTRRRRRRWALAGGGLLVAGLAGFLAVAALLPNPNRQLIRDLPVLENLDQYRQVRDIEFLRMLQREDLFSEESGDGK